MTDELTMHSRHIMRTHVSTICFWNIYFVIYIDILLYIWRHYLFSESKILLTIIGKFHFQPSLSRFDQFR